MSKFRFMIAFSPYVAYMHSTASKTSRLLFAFFSVVLGRRMQAMITTMGRRGITVTQVGTTSTTTYKNLTNATFALHSNLTNDKPSYYNNNNIADEYIRGQLPIVTHRSDPNYEDAIAALNSLQSNAENIARIKLDPKESAQRTLPSTVKYLARIGLSVDDIDRLNVIHVSGTKGKGSTCAFCESILRQHNCKTGFYSSPHMIAVRERIRINGRPLSEQAFASYFFQVYDQIFKKKQDDSDMPPYFAFLTIMAFHVFLDQKVDVAVIEVGIGGQYDNTNVIRKPVVCGVSSLGIDHTNILGSSLEEIAWHKGGIFKPKVPVFIAPQNDIAVKLLQDRAKENGSPICLSRSVETHEWNGRIPELGLSGKVQLINAGLAIQLANCWLQLKSKSSSRIIPDSISETGDSLPECHPPLAPRLEINDKVAHGLRNCRWPGRYQILRSANGNIVYFLDGAHTLESSLTCIEWFLEASNLEKSHFPNKGMKRILVFNSTGSRSSETLLSPLLSANFDCAIFCPNIINTTANKYPADLIKVAETNDSACNRCELNRASWLKVQQTNGIQTRVNSSVVLPSISDTLNWISTDECNSDQFLSHVLVTGSLHLVGGVLSLLDPDLNENQETSVQFG